MEFAIDTSQWSWWIWTLHGLAALSWVGFIWFWFHFHSLEAAARGGMERAVQRYNRALRGFPNAVYAKMMGKRRIEP